MNYCCCAGIENYQLVSDIGFDGIELPGSSIAAVPQEDWDELRDKIVNGRIPCIGFNAALTPTVKICGPGFDIPSIITYAELLCQRLHDLGGKVVGIGSPKSRILPKGFDPVLAGRQMEEFLILFAKIAEPWDITVCWETLNCTETNFGLSFVDDGDIVRNLVNRGFHNIGLTADLFHLLVNGNKAEDIKDLSDLVRHIHIAEPPADFRGYPTRAYASRYRELLDAILQNENCNTISIETTHQISYTCASDALEFMWQLYHDNLYYK